MGSYSLALRTSNNSATGAALWEMFTGSMPAALLELGISLQTATAPYLGFGRSVAVGVTPTSPQTFVDEEDGNAPASLTQAAVAWATGPTAPANFSRRVVGSGTLGSGVIWAFLRGGLVVPPGKSIGVWAAGSTGFVELWAVIKE